MQNFSPSRSSPSPHMAEVLRGAGRWQPGARPIHPAGRRRGASCRSVPLPAPPPFRPISCKDPRRLVRPGAIPTLRSGRQLKRSRPALWGGLVPPLPRADCRSR
ncbi:unnamed protein product [Amoebophrya sp. A120]|nr:unnamed protein product [Amoebophrya sp. A120]|eukprot:GSA120T00004178001.1